MSAALAGSRAAPPPAVPVQSANDATTLALWLDGRSAGTVRAYGSDARAFLAHAAKPIGAVTVGDVQAFADSLAGLASASRARKLSAVKSLLTYAHRLGYTTFNVGAVDQAARDQGHAGGAHHGRGRRAPTMLALETGTQATRPCCGWSTVRWPAHLRGLRPGDGATCSRATRPGRRRSTARAARRASVLLPASVWRALAGALRSRPGRTRRCSRRSGAAPSIRPPVHRVVKAAAARAGLSAEVSAHWLRHAHASHALDRGAPIHLVQATLGHASVATTGRYLHAPPNDSSGRYLTI